MASEEAERRIQVALEAIASSRRGSLQFQRGLANLRALLMLLTSRRMGAVDRCLCMIRRTARDSSLIVPARKIRMPADGAALLENRAVPTKPARAALEK